MSDVTHPEHYHGTIEPIDFIAAHQLDFVRGNVVKYVTRAGRKGEEGVNDLLKAKFYIEFALFQIDQGHDPRQIG